MKEKGREMIKKGWGEKKEREGEKRRDEKREGRRGERKGEEKVIRRREKEKTDLIPACHISGYIQIQTNYHNSLHLITCVRVISW